MQLAHWLMIAGVLLVAGGFTGLFLTPDTSDPDPGEEDQTH